jgi:hypothetical protein
MFFALKIIKVRINLANNIIVRLTQLNQQTNYESIVKIIAVRNEAF